MEKNEKRTYLHPQTEVVRFSVNDIITTSNISEILPEGPGAEDDPANKALLDFE